MKYEIKITDGIDVLTGDFYADTKAEAEQAAKEYYAVELDTEPDEITIIN